MREIPFIMQSHVAFEPRSRRRGQRGPLLGDGAARARAGADPQVLAPTAAGGVGLYPVERCGAVYKPGFVVHKVDIKS